MKLKVDSNFKQRKMKLQVVFNFKRVWMKLQVVSTFNLVNNEATSYFQAQKSQEWNYKLIQFQTTENEATSCFQLQTSQEWSYRLFPTSIESIMNLQVVFGLKRVNNETTSWSNYKQPKMKLQVVFNLKWVWNEATSCFHVQSTR